MTVQVSDRVVYNGETYYTFSDPFFYYRHSIKPKERPLFNMESSANLKGYDVDYEIRENKLFVIKFEGNLIVERGRTDYYEVVGIDAVFPGQKEAFAEWFTGDLVLLTAEQVTEKVRQGINFSQEVLYLYFDTGKLMHSSMVNNKVVNRIVRLEGELFRLKHYKKRTLWFYIGHKFFPKWVHDEMDYW